MSERPRLLVVAGPNGSGKTTVTEQGLAHEWFGGCEYVNPDLIARDEYGGWNDPVAVAKAATEAQRRRERCVAEPRSLAFESVFSAPDKIDFVRRAAKLGFFVRLFFVGTASPTINAARIARRVMEGGHDVPITKVVSRYVKSITNCARIAREVDRLYLYDNSIDGAAPRLVVRASEGRIVKAYGAACDWMRPIVDALSEDEGR
ncbi:MAG: zeta toxin family protein [Polyangiales bacterium]